LSEKPLIPTNLSITEITPDVLLVHQIKASQRFTRSDGLIFLPDMKQSSLPIIIDLNIEPPYIHQVFDKYIKDVSKNSFIYIASHTHLDHSAHVYYWERLGAKIYAPLPHSLRLMDKQRLIRELGFNQAENGYGEQFVDTMGFCECSQVQSFQPGDTLKFGKFNIETIPFNGHSVGHIGFFFPIINLFHISCLGFDILNPNTDGFGPWYGFEECNLPQFKKDIDIAEKIFLEKGNILTSSHSYIVTEKTRFPFEYMRKKIEGNHKKIKKIIQESPFSLKEVSIQKIMEYLLSIDLFFPKKKMNTMEKAVYTLWEYWIIKKHLDLILNNF
jgi:hypothetical protein